MNNLKTWFAENKTSAIFATLFLTLSCLAGWFAYGSWDDYSTSVQSYTEAMAKLEKLAKQTPPPTKSNLAILEKSINADQAGLNDLLNVLGQYRIPAFRGIDKAKQQDAPQLLQDALRAQVTKLKTIAGTTGATIPSGFYLAFEEYENRLPSPEDAISLAKQLTVLNWISEQLISHSGLIIAEFSKITAITTPNSAKNDRKPLSPAAATKPTPAPYENIASLRVSFRSDQGSLREILNAFSKAPYFMVIDSMQLQNTVTEPPRRDSVQHQTTQVPSQSTSDGQTNAVQRIPIVVGREEINASLRIRILDFPDRTQKLPSNLK